MTLAKKQRFPSKHVYWKAHKQKRNGKYKGGIDNVWYTYECLIPHLLLFYKEIMLLIHEPDKFSCDIILFSFMQDGAPSHISQWTQRILKSQGIKKHKHIGNSLDTNVIEKVWMPICITITQDWGRPHTIEWSDRAWHGKWDNLHMDKVDAAVARMAAINTLILGRE